MRARRQSRVSCLERSVATPLGIGSVGWVVHTFGDFPRFEQLADGTYYARAGVQTNCGGIAGIHVRIHPIAADTIACSVSDNTGEHDSGYGKAVPGSAMHDEYRDAVFEGAREACESAGCNIGVSFQLIDALVHMVDANPSMFKLAGTVAMIGWLRLQGLVKISEG